MAGAHEPPELATTNHSSSTTLAAHSGSLDMERKEQDKAEADTVEMAQLQYLKAEHPHAHPHSQSQHQHPPAVDRPEDLAGSASSEQLATEMEIPIELARQITDIGPPPDGGLEAWLCVFGTFFILFCVIGISMSFGQFKLWYIHHQLLGYTESQVAWLGSVQSTLAFLGAVFAGRFFDAHGPRILVVAGTLGSVSALVGIAFCHKYYQFMLAHILFGLSACVVFAPATAIAGHWFLKKRSTAVGIIICGAGVGGIIYPIMLKGLLDKLSFRNTMLIVAGFNFVLLMPACLWMKSRLPPRQAPPLRALAKPWKEKRYAFLVIGAMVYEINVFSPYFNAPVLAAQNHLPEHIADYALAILQVGSFVGRVAGGILADRFGVWYVFGTMNFVAAISVFVFWTGVSGTGATIAGLVIYGIASGSWFTLVSAAVATVSPMREIGMRLGMMWSCVALPVLAGPVISGALINADNGRFTKAGVFVGCTLLVAAFLQPGPRMLEVVQGWVRRGRNQSKKTDEEAV